MPSWISIPTFLPLFNWLILFTGPFPPNSYNPVIHPTNQLTIETRLVISNQLLTPTASNGQVEKEVSRESWGFPMVPADTNVFLLAWRLPLPPRSQTYVPLVSHRSWGLCLSSQHQSLDMSPQPICQKRKRKRKGCVHVDSQSPADRQKTDGQ